MFKYSCSGHTVGAKNIQKDHVELIKKCINRLKSNGTLIFSTNFRKFKLDIDSLTDLQINDITEETIPVDFERNRKIHYCWKIKRKINER